MGPFTLLDYNELVVAVPHDAANVKWCSGWAVRHYPDATG